VAGRGEAGCANAARRRGGTGKVGIREVRDVLPAASVRILTPRTRGSVGDSLRESPAAQPRKRDIRRLKEMTAP